MQSAVHTQHIAHTLRQLILLYACTSSCRSVLQHTVLLLQYIVFIYTCLFLRCATAATQHAKQATLYLYCVYKCACFCKSLTSSQAPITLVRTTVDVNREPLAVACRALLCGRAFSTALALLSDSAFCSLHTVLPAALSAAPMPLPASMSSAVQQTAILASSASASCIKGSLRAAAAAASRAGEVSKEGAGDTPLVDAPPADAPIGDTPCKTVGVFGLLPGTGVAGRFLLLLLPSIRMAGSKAHTRDCAQLSWRLSSVCRPAMKGWQPSCEL
jgi:hypothetical protein